MHISKKSLHDSSRVTKSILNCYNSTLKKIKKKQTQFYIKIHMRLLPYFTMEIASINNIM